MTDLPSDRAYIQSEETDTESPISEQTLQKIGSAINFLNDRYQLSIEEFTSSGTFTPPEGVDTVLLIGCGGGGGGAGQNTATAWRAGNGALLGFKAVSVTPLTNYTVTIGGGGSGVLGAGPANDGGNTTFDSLATFLGGSGGFFEGSSDPDPTVLFRSGSSTGSAKGYRGGGRVISLNEFATNTIAHEIGPESSPFLILILMTRTQVAMVLLVLVVPRELALLQILVVVVVMPMQTLVAATAALVGY